MESKRIDSGFISEHLRGVWATAVNCTTKQSCRDSFCLHSVGLRWLLVGCCVFYFAGCDEAETPVVITAADNQPLEVDGPSIPKAVSESGAKLYQKHCQSCHGVTGDGAGRAARYLFPKPRDFRVGKFRYISTSNGVPTRTDIVEAIQKGRPGTSMRGFPEFSPEERERLVDEVLLRFRKGAYDRFLARQESADESADLEAATAFAHDVTTPGEIVGIPEIGDADEAAIEHGKAIYQKLNCQACHGQDGRGDWNIQLRSDENWPQRARDLAFEHYRGGTDAGAIFLRLRLGMPGSSMPANPLVPVEDLVALVHYCKSLQAEPKVTLTNHTRRELSSGAAYLKWVGKNRPSQRVHEAGGKREK